MTDQRALPVLQVRDGAALANSRDVAEFFGKQHKDVLAAVRNLLAKEPELAGRNFTPFKNNDLTGESTARYEMDRDGFSLLAMGFTGSKALRWKLLYIEAFNRMEAALRAAPLPAAAPVALNDPHQLRAALLGYTEQVIALQDANAGLTAKVECLAPKAAALATLEAKIGDENISTVAKGIGIAPGALFAWMGGNGWLYRSRDNAPWRAFQDKINAGLLKVNECPDRTRADRTFLQVMVTPRGRARLAELLAQGDLLTVSAAGRSTTKRSAAA